MHPRKCFGVYLKRSQIEDQQSMAQSSGDWMGLVKTCEIPSECRPKTPPKKRPRHAKSVSSSSQPCQRPPCRPMWVSEMTVVEMLETFPQAGEILLLIKWRSLLLEVQIIFKICGKSELVYRHQLRIIEFLIFSLVVFQCCLESLLT